MSGLETERGSCAGLSEDGPRMFQYLVSLGGIVWAGLGGVACGEGMSLGGGVVFEVSKDSVLFPVCSLPPACESGCELSAFPAAFP